IASAIFALAVWRASRSLLFAALSQVLTFATLIQATRTTALHPGLWCMVALAVVAYSLVSYSIEARRRVLVVAGVAIGAATLSKINVGLFAVVALVFAFVVGNERIARAWRVLVVAGATLLPFALMAQRLYRVETFQFAALVSLTVLATAAALWV